MDRWYENVTASTQQKFPVSPRGCTLKLLKCHKINEGQKFPNTRFGGETRETYRGSTKTSKVDEITSEKTKNSRWKHARNFEFTRKSTIEMYDSKISKTTNIESNPNQKRLLIRAIELDTNANGKTQQLARAQSNYELIPKI